MPRIEKFSSRLYSNFAEEYLMFPIFQAIFNLFGGVAQQSAAKDALSQPNNQLSLPYAFSDDLQPNQLRKH